LRKTHFGEQSLISDADNVDKCKQYLINHVITAEVYINFVSK